MVTYCLLSEGLNISSIIIDGYNIVGISHRDLESQRNSLIEYIINYRKATLHNIVIVFDGWKTGGGMENSSVKGGVRIIYSRLGERADSVIKRIITTDRREWIVVSSDREIASYSWSVGAVPITSEDFSASIMRTGRDANEVSEPDESEDEWEVRTRKGNSNRLSKKEKAVQRALSKL